MSDNKIETTIEKNDSGLNRRDFLKIAGVGAAAMAIPRMGFAANSAPKSLSSITQEEIETDVLVIGGGYAGVFAAIKAREEGASVTLVEKGSVFKSGLSPFARGFSYFDKDSQDPAVLKKYTNMIGNYLSNASYLKLYVDGTKAIYEDMKSWGFFTTGNDFAGIMRNQVKKSGVKIIERTMITNLIKQNNQVVGAIGFPMEEDKAIVIKAKAVILCAGAGSFKSPGFFANSITSDGDAMAYRIGAEITGKEFQDTHTTQDDYPAASYKGWQGMMEGTNPEAMAVQIENNLNLGDYITAHTVGAPVTRGPRPGGGEKGPVRPTLKDPGGGIEWGGPQNLKGKGKGKGPRPEGGEGARPRPVRGPMVGGSSAGLSVHKAEGLWPADDKCGSNITGLYAAGDALGSMMYGGSYAMGGASSSGSAAQGVVAGISAARYALKIDKPNISKTEIEKIKTEIFEPRQLKKGYSPDWVLQLIQSTMIPYYVLYVKKEDRLKAALSNIMFFQEHFGPKLIADDTHDLRMVHEVRNMLLNAEMKLRTSLFRTESRGNHFREDYPARDDANWLAWIVLKNENGKMKFRKIPVPETERPDPSISYEKRYPTRYPGELEYVKSKKIV